MSPRRVITGHGQEPRQRFVEELRLLRGRSGGSLRTLGDGDLVDTLADGWILDEVHAFEEGDRPRRLWRDTPILPG